MHPVRDLYFMARSVLVIADMIGDTLKREWLIQGEEGMSRGVLNNNNFQGHIDRQAHCILEALGLFKKSCPARPQSFLRAERTSST